MSVRPPTAHQTRLGLPQGDHHAQGTLRCQGLEASRRRIDPVYDHADPAKFTIPSPFGHEIGQLADAMTRRTKDCSPDAMGVVPTRGRDHAHRHLHEKVPRLTGSRRPARRPARPGNTPPAAHISHVADAPGTGIGSLWNHRQAWDAGAGEGHDATDLGLCTISGLGEVSDEAYLHQTTEGPERTPGLEAVPPDPRDPDLVRAKHSRGPRHSNLDQTGLLDTKARCRYG